jgi:hypothetical protein
MVEPGHGRSRDLFLLLVFLIIFIEKRIRETVVVVGGVDMGREKRPGD